MAYRMVYLRIRCNCYNSGYGKDSGWVSNAAQAAFKEESRRLFQELGWELKPGSNGVCDKVIKGHQDLYLHPMNFSGVLDEANITDPVAVIVPALEARLRTLQDEQMRLFQLAVESGPENTEYDDRISEVNAAMTALLKRKGELEQADPADAGHSSRMRAISDRLETTDSSIGEFKDDTVRQLISSIKVLNKERLSIRFKDGTEFEQIIESIGRASA